jgi:hypothetical protein
LADNKITVVSNGEYQEVQFEYQRAQRILTLLDHDGFKDLMQIITEKAVADAKTARNTPPYDERKAQRDMESWISDKVRERIVTILSSAKQAPIPTKVGGYRDRF